MATMVASGTSAVGSQTLYTNNTSTQHSFYILKVGATALGLQNSRVGEFSWQVNRSWTGSIPSGSEFFQHGNKPVWGDGITGYVNTYGQSAINYSRWQCKWKYSGLAWELWLG